MLVEPIEITPEPRLFVLTRRDLPWSVRAVQAMHAATNLIAKRSQDIAAWGHYGPRLVLLGVSDERELQNYLSTLSEDMEPFFEPDLQGELTAIAFLTLNNPPLGHLRLL